MELLPSCWKVLKITRVTNKSSKIDHLENEASHKKVLCIFVLFLNVESILYRLDLIAAISCISPFIYYHIYICIYSFVSLLFSSLLLSSLLFSSLLFSSLLFSSSLHFSSSPLLLFFSSLSLSLSLRIYIYIYVYKTEGIILFEPSNSKTKQPIFLQFHRFAEKAFENVLGLSSRYY